MNSDFVVPTVLLTAALGYCITHSFLLLNGSTPVPLVGTRAHSSLRLGKKKRIEHFCANLSVDKFLPFSWANAEEDGS